MLSYIRLIEAIDCNSQVNSLPVPRFRKAFDIDPHDELLMQLRRAGITGSVWRWFHAYLAESSGRASGSVHFRIDV